MRNQFAFAILLTIPLPSAHAQESTRTNTITLGAGGGWIPGATGVKGGPVFNGVYEYRLHKYLALETGVNTTLTTSSFSTVSTVSTILAGSGTLGYYSNTGFSIASYRGSSRSTAVPLGFRAILPIVRGRGEIFAGTGAAYIWNTRSDSSLPAGAFAVNGKWGVRFAVDKQRHFWIGSTGSASHAFASAGQTYIDWTADLGFRFGR